jgi:hypothetical protein
MKPRYLSALLLSMILLVVLGVFVSYFSFVLLFFVIVVSGIILSARYSKRTVQRPASQTTAFPPPPMPDTVTVTCRYCGTSQTFKETCEKCGAPLPAPTPPSSA